MTVASVEVEPSYVGTAELPVTAPVVSVRALMVVASVALTKAGFAELPETAPTLANSLPWM